MIHETADYYHGADETFPKRLASTLQVDKLQIGVCTE
jgi:hypothetical protein